MNKLLITGIFLAILVLGVFAFNLSFARENNESTKNEFKCSKESCSGQCSVECNKGFACGCLDCTAKTKGTCGCGK